MREPPNKWGRVEGEPRQRRRVVVANSRPRESQKEILSGAQRKLARRIAPMVKKGGGVSEVVYGFQRKAEVKFEVGSDTLKGA